MNGKYLAPAFFAVDKRLYIAYNIIHTHTKENAN